MDKWERKIRESLKRNLVKIFLFGKYVDDVNLATSIIPKGHSWKVSPEGRMLEWSQERADTDMEEGLSDSMRTLELIREEANVQVKGLKFTVDSQEKNPDGKCPMLDLKVWKEQTEEGVTIRHTFFEKDVSSPLVFHAKGAHTWRSKLVTPQVNKKWSR